MTFKPHFSHSQFKCKVLILFNRTFHIFDLSLRFDSLNITASNAFIVFFSVKNPHDWCASRSNALLSPHDRPNSPLNNPFICHLPESGDSKIFSANFRAAGSKALEFETTVSTSPSFKASSVPTNRANWVNLSVIPCPTMEIITLIQFPGTDNPIATSFNPIDASCVTILKSQHIARQNPAAGQAPLTAAIVSNGVVYNRARNVFDMTQKLMYCTRDVRGAYSSARSSPAVKTLRLRVDVKTIPRTLEFASSSERVLRSAVQKAVFMEFTGSWWRETIARALSRAYETERMSAIMLEHRPNSDSLYGFLHLVNWMTSNGFCLSRWGFGVCVNKIVEVFPFSYGTCHTATWRDGGKGPSLNEEWSDTKEAPSAILCHQTHRCN